MSGIEGQEGRQENGGRERRDRCASAGNIEEMFRKKREGGIIRTREGEADIFRNLKKTARALGGKRR